jgi:hypothetical protein
LASNFMRPSGVAAVMASGCALMNGRAKLSPRSDHHFTAPPVAGHVVIATGNAAWRNARPKSAGLKML